MNKEEIERMFFELMPKSSARHAAANLVRRGWRATYAELFGEDFVSVLAPHHIEAIEWHWRSRTNFLDGEKPEYWAYFPIWSRGHMKSTIARYMAVIDSTDSRCRILNAGILVFQNAPLLGVVNNFSKLISFSSKIK